jgi:translation initiation factor eIF-2B subunit alpha
MVKPGTTTAPSRDLTLSGIAGTMFELVQALNDGAETLKKRVPSPIGLTAGCELFIGFVTLFPHESAVSPHFRPI